MTPLVSMLCRRIALATALFAFACQKDGDAVFDNGHLDDSGAGGSGVSLGGTHTSGGDTSTGASSMAGSISDASDGGTGATAGSSGSNQGGSAGESTAGSGGRGEEGGSAGTGGMAGHAGTANPVPEPVTITIDEFEDAYVENCEPSENYGTAPTINIDGDNQCASYGLLRPLLDQIPDGALVSQATLTLECINFGTPIAASYVQGAWKEGTVTWNNRPEAGSSIANVACEDLGPVTIDLTEVLKVWLGGETPYGIYLRGEALDGIDFASSDAEEASTRPQLSVTYVLPVK